MTGRGRAAQFAIRKIVSRFASTSSDNFTNGGGKLVIKCMPRS